MPQTQTQPSLPQVPLLGWKRLHTTFEALRAEQDTETFPERLLRSIEVSYRAAEADLQKIPRTGPAVIVANHPFGMVETAALATMVRKLRPDMRILANEFVSAVPELRGIIIPVGLESGSVRANAGAVRKAVEFLQRGGLLVVFPAGAVSHFQWRERGSADPAWNPAVARIIGMAVKRGAFPVTVPVFVPGSNSAMFHVAGMIHPRFRTAMLAHEFFNKRRTEVELRVGRPVSATRLLSMGSDEERIEYLRWRTYLLACRSGFRRKAPDSPALPGVEAPVRGSALAAELASLPESALLCQNGDLAVYLSEAPGMPLLLREIGRLRELTFRALGEGSGHPLDLDRFDWYYQHLFVWNARTEEVVGAYRLQGSDVSQDVYTRTLFHFDQRFLDALGPALELGRSFVRKECQKSFAPLLLLWKGIGRYVAENPRYRVLFGPVSISNQYRSASRELMIGYLEKQARLTEWSGMVRPRNAPPAVRGAVYCRDMDELSEAISDVEASPAGVPVLLRQYLRLGGRLLGFNIDRKFSDVMDGLIVVDLARSDPKLLERYLGKDEAARFLSHTGRI